MKPEKKITYIPQGYKSFVTAAGIKDTSVDLGIIFSDVPCNAAAVFTKNKVAGNPVLIGRKHIRKGKIQAVIVNSKNSNVATGKAGYEASMKVCSALAAELKIPSGTVFPSSTGVIGRALPFEKIIHCLGHISSQMQSPPDFAEFAKAIMTTDTFAKFSSVKIGSAHLVGVAKGSGMIEPNMATMLAYFFTDADISTHTLKKLLKKIVESTFNSLSIDSDMSTSDTALIMANGRVGKVPEKEFEAALTTVATDLVRMLARDGEGATKLFVVDVIGAANARQAKAIGKSIINSPLVKTAIYKGDPNWGRIFMAVGKTPNVKVIPEKILLRWGGRSYANDEIKELTSYLQQNEELHLEVNLNVGRGSWRCFGCDLTEEYVKINAYYTT